MCFVALEETRPILSTFLMLKAVLRGDLHDKRNFCRGEAADFNSVLKQKEEDGLVTVQIILVHDVEQLKMLIDIATANKM